MAPKDTPFAPLPDPSANPRRSDRPEWRDDTPVMPAPDVLARHKALVLDPLSAVRLPGQPAPEPVAYIADQLLVPRPVAFAPDLRRVLSDAAADQGLAWVGLPELRPDGGTDGGTDGADVGDVPQPAAAEPRRVDPRDPVVVGTLVPQGSQPVAAPDAWAVLQSTRTRAEALGLRADLAGLSLNHLFQAGSHVAGHPVVGMSHVAGHPVSEPDGLAEYVMAGSGGRAPVAWVGERPAYHEEGWEGRRPVVAVLDTGCGKHDWFEYGLTTHAEWHGTTAEVVDQATDPERTGDVVGPLDGQLDTHSGHGTFIAGLIRQICPKADILALRVMSSDGIVEEHDLIRALGVLNGLVADAVEAGAPPPIDIVSLSLGYYHELPSDQDFDPVLLQQLQALGQAGVAVVACAGNDATTREMYPAAFLPHDNGVVEKLDPQCIPVVSVGALNPDGSIALFSNGGDWVAAWDVGAALVSTFPTTFNGGSQPSVSMPTSLGRSRSTIDPDCFAGGFGTWSGTSFSTPVLAGRLARSLLSEGSAKAGDQLSRIWYAVTEETGIARPDA